MQIELQHFLAFLFGMNVGEVSCNKGNMTNNLR